MTSNEIELRVQYLSDGDWVNSYGPALDADLTKAAMRARTGPGGSPHRILMITDPDSGTGVVVWEGKRPPSYFGKAVQL